jgi:Dolichyl-phosphate-mannose-protein mannosyltransferase
MVVARTGHGRAGESTAALDEPRIGNATASGLGVSMALLAIVAGALLLRLHNLEQWGIWDDELFTVKHAIGLTSYLSSRVLAWLPHRLWFELAGIDVASLDPQQIWTWRAAGITEWTLRAPVALLGALTILVLGSLGRRALGTGATLWLCLLLALSPWHLWLSQLGRFYMQLFLLYNLALLLYYQATTEGSHARAALAMACLVLAFYTSPIALMILGVFGIDIAVSWLRRRPTGMRPAFWAMGLAAIALCLLEALPDVGAGLELAASLAEEYGYARFRGSPQSIPVLTMGMIYLIGVPVVVIAALGFWALLQRNERLAILLAAAAVVPLAAFIGFNLLGKDTHVRYTFVALFAWLALAAIGIEATVTALRSRWGTLVSALPGVALLSTFALADYIYMTGGAGYRPLWREAIAYVEAHRRPGELIGGDWAAHRTVQYYLGDADAVLLPHGFTDADMRALAPRPAWILLRAHHPSSGDRTDQLSAAGALQAYFTNRVAQPNYSINVYYYSGQGPAPDGSYSGQSPAPDGGG